MRADWVQFVFFCLCVFAIGMLVGYLSEFEWFQDQVTQSVYEHEGIAK